MTAVEWYFKQMQSKEHFTQEEFDGIYEQAKEMEKQQIIQSHLQGSKNSIIEVSKYIKVNNTLDTIKNIEKGIDEHCDGIKYYNETFKNK
jgi:hypothetical protein